MGNGIRRRRRSGSRCNTGRSWPATGRGREVADRLDWIGLDWMRLWEVARRLRLTGVGAGMGGGGGREAGGRNEGAWRTDYPEADGFWLGTV